MCSLRKLGGSHARACNFDCCGEEATVIRKTAIFEKMKSNREIGCLKLENVGDTFRFYARNIQYTAQNSTKLPFMSQNRRRPKI